MCEDNKGLESPCAMWMPTSCCSGLLLRQRTSKHHLGTQLTHCRIDKWAHDVWTGATQSNILSSKLCKRCLLGPMRALSEHNVMFSRQLVQRYARRVIFGAFETRKGFSLPGAEEVSFNILNQTSSLPWFWDNLLTSPWIETIASQHINAVQKVYHCKTDRTENPSSSEFLLEEEIITFLSPWSSTPLCRL